MESNCLSYSFCLLVSISFGFSLNAMESLPEGNTQISITIGLKKFDALLKRDPLLANTKDSDGNTLLIQAIEQGKKSYVKSLLSANANLWIPGKEGRSAFHTAAKVGDLSIARLLLQQHMDDKEWDIDHGMMAGQTPDMCAMVNKKNSCVSLFSNFKRSQDPFFQAILFGNIEKIDQILAINPLKINENIQLDNSCTPMSPLSWAVFLEDENLVDHLLKSGAHIYTKNSGFSAWQWAANSPSIRSIMAKYDDRLQIYDKFLQYIFAGGIKKIKELLKNSREKLKFCIQFEEWSPLQQAVMVANLKVIKVLTRDAVISESVSRRCEPVLYLACLRGNSEIIEYLGKLFSVDLNFQRSNEYWPLNYCTSEATKESLFKLFRTYERGFQESAPQEYITNAARYKRPQLVDRALNDLKADINEFDNKGLTALHWACIKGDPNLLGHLLSKGADPNILEKNKKRSCFRLILRMHESSPKKEGEQFSTSALLPCYFLLRCYGAKPGKCDIEGYDVLYWIKKQNMTADEKKLIRKILNLNSNSKEDCRAILTEIKQLQEKEFNIALAAGNNTKAQWIKDNFVTEECSLLKLLRDYKNIYESAIAKAI